MASFLDTNPEVVRRRLFNKLSLHNLREREVHRSCPWYPKYPSVILPGVQETYKEKKDLAFRSLQSAIDHIQELHEELVHMYLPKDTLKAFRALQTVLSIAMKMSQTHLKIISSVKVEDVTESCIIVHHITWVFERVQDHVVDSKFTYKSLDVIIYVLHRSNVSISKMLNRIHEEHRNVCGN